MKLILKIMRRRQRTSRRQATGLVNSDCGCNFRNNYNFWNNYYGDQVCLPCE